MKFGPTLLAALLAAAATAQNAPQGIRVVVAGRAIQFQDQQPTEQNGRVLVPLRGVFEQLGASVDWEPSTQTVTARRRETRVVLTVGQLDASVNGHDVHLDVPVSLIGGSTMVPLRFVSEALGAYVDWDAGRQEVDITQAGNYEFPKTPPPPPKERVREVIVRVPSSPPPVTILIPEDSVLPLVLANRLTSYDARPGDRFSATLDTYGGARLMDLPAGTRVEGRVSYARPRRGNEPGLLEIQFDQLVTPGGRHFPISGRVIGLDSNSVIRGEHGLLIARDKVRNDRVFYTGYGPRVGVIVGLRSHGGIADIEITDRVHRTVSREVQRRTPTDVELAPGRGLVFACTKL